MLQIGYFFLRKVTIRKWKSDRKKRKNHHKLTKKWQPITRFPNCEDRFGTDNIFFRKIDSKKWHVPKFWFFEKMQNHEKITFYTILTQNASKNGISIFVQFFWTFRKKYFRKMSQTNVKNNAATFHTPKQCQNGLKLCFAFFDFWLRIGWTRSPPISPELKVGRGGFFSAAPET